VLDPRRRVTAILRGNEWSPARLIDELRKAVGVR
jgi:hypothetical protein